MLSLLSRFVKPNVLQSATEQNKMVSEIHFEDDKNHLLKDVVIGVDAESYLEQQLDPSEPDSIEDLEEDSVLTEADGEHCDKTVRNFLSLLRLKQKHACPFRIS